MRYKSVKSIGRRLIWGGTSLILWFGLTMQAQAVDATGRNPLSAVEQDQVQTLAAAEPHTSAAIRLHGGRSALRTGLANVQFLYSELRSPDLGTPLDARHAIAYYYDYVTNEVIRQTVDLTHGKIADVSISSGLADQPMATEIETEAVFHLLLEHAKFGPALRKIYAQHHSDPLQNGAQMKAQAGLFYPSSKVGTPLETMTQVCEIHRCLQIFLHATPTELIDTNNIVVDLSKGTVLWR